MAGDLQIKNQVAQWLFQNQAIRAAFREPLDKPAPVAARALAAKGPAADWAP